MLHHGNKGVDINEVTILRYFKPMMDCQIQEILYHHRLKDTKNSGR